MMRTTIVMLAAVAALFACVQSAPAADELFDTKDATAHLEKGIADIKGNNYDAAIREFDESVSINPDAEAYYYLGYTYYLKGKKGDAESRKKALEYFDKAYELNPRFTPGRLKQAGTGEAELETKATETEQRTAPPTSPQSAEPTPEQKPGQKASGQNGTQQPTPPAKAADKAGQNENAPGN